MFKAFLTFLFFFIAADGVYAQTAFQASEGEQENMLAKYLNASAVCAKMTDPEALYERGMLLLSDANDDAYIAAADCFTSAAMKNHTPSQLELGKLYEHGNGVSQSNIFAYKWYQTAVLLSNPDAISFRNKLEARMDLDEIAQANPMIQTTLHLIDLFNQREQADLEKWENEIAEEYRKFGVDISQYDIQEEGEKVFDNPLIEALIRDQKTQEQTKTKEKEKEKEKQNSKKELDKSEENTSERQPSRRRRRNQ